MTGGQIIGLATIIFIFGGPMIVGLVHVIVNGWAGVQKHKEDLELKHKLVDHGFSADEIERLMAATSQSARENSEAESQSELKKTLVEEGYSAEDIERIVNAGRQEAESTVAFKDAKAG